MSNVKSEEKVFAIFAPSCSLLFSVHINYFYVYVQLVLGSSIITVDTNAFSVLEEYHIIYIIEKPFLNLRT